jgi:hypothetical protein
MANVGPRRPLADQRGEDTKIDDSRTRPLEGGVIGKPCNKDQLAAPGVRLIRRFAIAGAGPDAVRPFSGRIGEWSADIQISNSELTGVLDGTGRDLAARERHSTENLLGTTATFAAA